MRDSNGWWQFVFYRHAWAIAALLHLEREGDLRDWAHTDWVRGLLFGYDAAEIQRFISSASDAPKSMSRSPSYKRAQVC